LLIISQYGSLKTSENIHFSCKFSVHFGQHPPLFYKRLISVGQ